MIVAKLNLKIFISYSRDYLYSQNYNFFRALLATKEKNKEGNDKFQFCDEREEEFKSYLIEENTKEIKLNNI